MGQVLLSVVAYHGECVWGGWDVSGIIHYDIMLFKLVTEAMKVEVQILFAL